MVKCKWSGDKNDEYCKNCNGWDMEVDGKKLSCLECAGYEPNPGDDDSAENVSEKTEETTEPMNPPESNEPESANTSETTENAEISKKETKTVNNKAKTKKAENKASNKAKKTDTVTKVKEEKKAEEKTENCNGEIKVVSMRYTSGATIKKGDNYFKFVSEEEWDVSQVDNIDDIREMLWAKLNAEVDSQIEELNNMN